MEEFQINILNIAGVLLAAYVGGLAIRRIGYPAILGELIIGIILGPGMLGWLEYTESVKVLAEFGIILLMVYIGMEIDFKDLKKASWPGLLATVGGFFVPFFLGYFYFLWLGHTVTSSLFVAIALGVTSLATKSRILIDLNLLNTRIAYVMVAGALLTDTLALVIFSGILSFTEASTVQFGQLIMNGIWIITFFTVTISIGTFVLPRIGKLISRSKGNNSTSYFTVILIVTFVYCKMAELAGMHSILGAFMAGLFLKRNLFSKSISQELNKAFYDISIGFMAPIFFVSAGFFVDVSVFTNDLELLVVITLLAVIGKIVGTALFYLPSGNGWREALTIGTGMNGRGAVEIIIAGIGLELQIIDKTVFSILVFMAILTTLTDPILLSWTSKWLRRRGELVYVEKRKGFLILGVNPVSLFLAKKLAEKQQVTMIDNNLEMVQEAKSVHLNCIHGNGLKEEVMSEASPETVSTFIAMTPNSHVNLLAAQLASDAFHVPNISLALSAESLDYSNERLKKMKASVFLGVQFNLDSWFLRARSEKLVEHNEKVQQQTQCQNYTTQLHARVPNAFPIIIQDTGGSLRLFHSEEMVNKGETVIFLTEEHESLEKE